MAGVNLNSLAGLGDKLGLSGLISSDSNLQNARVSYSVPLLPNGLTSEVSYSMTSYKLANNKEIEDLKLDGKSSTFDASLSYPIIKQRGETFTISSILSSKRLQDFQESNIKKDKKITSLGITLAYTKDKNIFGLNSQISSALTLTSGELAFVDSDSKEIDKDAARLAGNYNKISGYTNLAFKLNQNYTLNTNVTFQHSLGNKNLDGTEDFSIGGSNGVKVYPDGEFACENGIMFNTELFRTLPSFYGISNKVGVFYDIARGSFQNSSYDDTLKSRTLQDGGLSYYVNYKNVFAKAQFSKTIGSEKVQTEYIGDSSRFLLQAGASF
jgi:hemolysin activation/secretion protein